MNYETTYESENITIATPNYDATRCTSISFENIGDDNATIMGNIPLNAGDPPREFNNLANQVITKNFSITFAGVGSSPKILIIKTYNKPVK